MKRLAAALAALAVLIGAGLYWKHRAAPTLAQTAAGAAAKGQPGGVPVRIGTVRIGPISEEVSAIGTLLANESVMIRPEREGRIAAIHFTEGQIVRKGEKLIVLDIAEIEAQLAAVNSELSLNRSRLKRAEDLQEKKLFHFVVDSLHAAIEYEPDGLRTDLKLKALARSMTFLAVNGSFIKDQQVSGVVKVAFSKSTGSARAGSRAWFSSARIPMPSPAR